MLKSPKSPKFDPEFFERKLKSQYPGKTKGLKRKRDAGEGPSPKKHKRSSTATATCDQPNPKPIKRRKWLDRRESEPLPQIDLANAPMWYRNHMKEDIYTGRNLGSSFSGIHETVVETGMKQLMAELSPECRRQAERLENKRRLKVAVRPLNKQELEKAGVPLWYRKLMSEDILTGANLGCKQEAIPTGSVSPRRSSISGYISPTRSTSISGRNSPLRGSISSRSSPSVSSSVGVCSSPRHRIINGRNISGRNSPSISSSLGVHSSPRHGSISGRNSPLRGSISGRNSSLRGNISGRNSPLCGSISARSSLSISSSVGVCSSQSHHSINDRNSPSISSSLGVHNSPCHGSISSRNSPLRGRNTPLRGSISSRNSPLRGSISGRNTPLRGSISGHNSPITNSDVHNSLLHGSISDNTICYIDDGPEVGHIPSLNSNQLFFRWVIIHDVRP